MSGSLLSFVSPALFHVASGVIGPQRPWSPPSLLSIVLTEGRFLYNVVDPEAERSRWYSVRNN